MLMELMYKLNLAFQLLLLTDYLDILLLFFIFYMWFEWIRVHQPQLLLFFSSISFLGVVSYFLSLLASCTLLFYTTPLVIILISGATLYKNYLHQSYSDKSSSGTSTDWLSELLRTIFAVKSSAAYFACMIELKADDTLTEKSLIRVPFYYRIGLLLLEECLKRVNSCWHFSNQGMLIDFTVPFVADQSIADWQQFKQDAVLHTSTKAVVVLLFNYQSRQFSLIAKGKLYEPVEAASVARMVQRLMDEPSLLQKGKKYESFAYEIGHS